MKIKKEKKYLKESEATPIWNQARGAIKATLLMRQDTNAPPSVRISSLASG